MLSELSPAERERYARQIGLGGLTDEGQQRLKDATVLVTRVGGMGGPAAMMLAMAGVGRLILAHSGSLESPDLNRQVLGSEAGLGQARVEQFAAALRARNRWLAVETIDHEPDDDEALALARRVEVVISSPPSFGERLRLNRATVAAGKPLVDAAQWGMGGTLVVVDPGRTACLACLYPEPPPFEELFPVVGAISSALGSLAALEAIKILSGCGQPIFGRMLLLDGQLADARILELTRQADCRVCGPASLSL